MTDFVVSSLANAYTAFTSAANGDRVLLTDGTYDVGGSDHNLTKTSSSAVVKFMAQNRGGVILTGHPINLTSNNIIFEGFDLQYSQTSGNYITIDGANCQMTRNKIHLGNIASPGVMKWIEVENDDFLFDHNEVYNKTTVDPMFQLTGQVHRCRIIRNYFHDFIQNPGDTRSEVIRMGHSSYSYLDFDCEIAYNLIENIDADTEIISMKCTNVELHHNTLKNTLGSIVMRQCHNIIVRDNVLINTGIRFYGNGHLITRNKVLNVSSGGVSRPLYMGSANVEDTETVDGNGILGTFGVQTDPNGSVTYARCKNNTITNNYFNNGNSSSGIKILLGADLNGGTDGTRQLQPTNNIIVGNIVIASSGTLTDDIDGTYPSDWTLNTVSGNILIATGTAVIGDMPSSGYVTSSDRMNCLMENLQDVIELTPVDVGVDAP